MRKRVSTLEIILANSNGDDRNSLETILEGTPWVVIDAGEPEIENVVRDASVPIVFCDRSECWRKTVSTLKKTRRDVCVILLSNETDEAGNEEVIKYGGFDTLTRPLLKTQVLPMLLFAYTYWRGHGQYLSRFRQVHSSTRPSLSG